MIYSFVCKDCEKYFEINSQPFVISNKQICPNCRSQNVYRKYNINSIHYKGKGFTKKVKGDEETSPWKS